MNNNEAPTAGTTTRELVVDGITVPAGTAVRITRFRPLSERGHKVRINLPGVAGYLDRWTTAVTAA